MLVQISTIKNVLLNIFLSCLIIACTQQRTIETFIVPQDTVAVNQKNSTHIPSIPHAARAYYFPSNFIIDSTGQVFFYQEQINWNNDINIEWNMPPEFIDLKPKDIVQIPDNSIEEFIRLNILSIDSLKRYISVASSKDTIKSVGLSKIMSMCKEQNYHIRWKFRIITQEEAIVLGYKARQEYYDFNTVKWDSSKIKMPIANKDK